MTKTQTKSNPLRITSETIRVLDAHALRRATGGNYSGTPTISSANVTCLVNK